MAMNSTTHVLAIPELLEQVLLHLPPQRVLQCQRVCHTWKSVINTSHALRRLLRYEPWPQKQNTTSSGQLPLLNPLLSYLGFFCGGPKHVGGEGTDAETFLEELTLQVKDRRGRIPPNLSNIGNPQRHPCREMFLLLHNRLDDTPGSWTTMLATQTPRCRIEVNMPRWEVNNDDAYYIITSAHSDGLRLGELVATLAECQERQDCGIDKRDTPSYLAAFLRPLHETMWGSEIEYDNLKKALGLVETDADTKVVYWEGWFGESPAFSLKRKVEMANGDLCTPAGAISFRLTKQDYDLDFLHFMRWSDCEPKLELDIYRHQLID